MPEISAKKSEIRTCSLSILLTAVSSVLMGEYHMGQNKQQKFPSQTLSKHQDFLHSPGNKVAITPVG